MYTTTRLGAFNTAQGFREKQLAAKGKKLSVIDRLTIGLLAGGIGACVGNPAEVVLVRMTTDGRLPPEQRRNYRNAFVALARITREEGFWALFKGVDATICRAMALNCAQLGMYSQAKSFFSKYIKGDFTTYLSASLVSGFMCSFASLPFDIVKSRVQSAKPGTYKGAMDCAVQLFKNEGVLMFWRGFVTYFCRIAPHTILTFLFLEQINKIYDMIKKH